MSGGRYARRGTARRGGSGGGSRWMWLRYAGVCKVCGTALEADERAFWDAGARTVTCDRLDCAEADGLTEVKPLTGPWDKRVDLRVLSGQRVGSAAPARFSAPPRVHTARFSSGAVVSVNARGRCEDAPCCGCCS